MIDWIVWILISKIINRVTIDLFLLLLLYMFIAEGASGFLIYISVNVFMASVIIGEVLIFPYYSYKEHSICVAYLDNIWLNCDKILFGSVTADWCVTRK